MVISVVSVKGGTGKSTITLNLAAVLSSQGLRVLIIDSDPQGSIAHWSTITDLDTPKVMVDSLPSISKKIRKLSKKYDYILFDAPPTMKKRMRSVIHFADLLIIPVTPGMADYWSTGMLLDLYAEEKERRPDLDARLLISRVDRRTKSGREFRSILERLSIPIFMTEIPQRSVYNDVWYNYTTVESIKGFRNSARDFRHLAREVLMWSHKTCLTN